MKQGATALAGRAFASRPNTGDPGHWVQRYVHRPSIHFKETIDSLLAIVFYSVPFKVKGLNLDD